MKAYLSKGVIFYSRDVAIIMDNIFYPHEAIIDPSVKAVGCDKIHIDCDFNNHDLITVQLGALSNGLDPEDINCYSHFEVDVTMSNGEDPVCEVKDRNFKLEHLSMELQKRIHDKAEEMYQDWMKVKHDL